MARGFALNRYLPAEQGSEWFAADSLDLRGDGRVAAGVTLDYAHKPLVLYDGDGNYVVAPVKHQMFLHFGAAVTLAERVRLAASMPLAVIDKGRPGLLGDTLFQVKRGAAAGDLRLGADVLLFGKYREPFRITAGLQVTLPTGSRESFTGDGKVRLLPRVSVAGDAGLFTYAAQVAFDGRFLNERYGNVPVGKAINFAAAVGLRSPDGALVIGPEVHGSKSVESGGFTKKRATPVELIFGAHYTILDTVRLGVGGGPDFTHALGSPDYRLLASLTYLSPVAAPPPPPPAPEPVAAPAPPPDGDADGIIDAEDACPAEPGVANADKTKNGCPAPKDADGDKITDDVDACPQEAGVASEDKAKNGCPAPKDRDGDKITDDVDACPDVAGDADTVASKNGCPKVRLTKGAIEILERIEFDEGKATLRPESDSILQAVRRVLTEHAEIKKVRVEGHTDSTGGKKRNEKLSQERVDAVVAWLVAHDIEAARLEAKGFGSARPLDTNKTPEGRQRNRRVEFIIVENGDTGAK